MFGQVLASIPARSDREREEGQQLHDQKGSLDQFAVKGKCDSIRFLFMYIHVSRQQLS